MYKAKKLKRTAKTIVGLLLLFQLNTLYAQSTQQRIARDVAQGKPIVIHVSVALADNKNQWIAPVPEAIGNGQHPKSNLYWGARYGVRTFLLKDDGWKLLGTATPGNDAILERLVLSKKFTRQNHSVQVYLVADAWDGRFITDTIEQFLKYSGGHDSVTVKTEGKQLQAGGAAHLNAYIGHNALMDYFGIKDKFISTPAAANSDSGGSDAIVLACKSKPYFETRLESAGAHSLVLTTGLMAPEAYSLAAAINVWIKGAKDNNVRKAAAAAYAKYQKIRIKSAESLFDANR